MVYFNSEKKSPLLALLNSKRLEISPKNGWRARARLPDGQVAGEPMTSFPNWRSILEIVRTVFAAEGGEESPPQKSEITAPPRR